TDFVRALRPMATTEVIRAITDSTVAIPGLDRRVSGGPASWRAVGACSVMVVNLLVGWGLLGDRLGSCGSSGRRERSDKPVGLCVDPGAEQDGGGAAGRCGARL